MSGEQRLSVSSGWAVSVLAGSASDCPRADVGVESTALDSGAAPHVLLKTEDGYVRRATTPKRSQRPNKFVLAAEFSNLATVGPGSPQNLRTSTHLPRLRDLPTPRRSPAMLEPRDAPIHPLVDGAP